VFLHPATPGDGENPAMLCALHHRQNPLKST
jgi:hypothetical protein